MGYETLIGWTHHTFNPWWGCMKVSDGCAHCYAETLAARYGHEVWGPAAHTHRRMMSNKYWEAPRTWDRRARLAGERRRVFVASMADVFEDHPEVVAARARLFALIEECQALDWLLLTKRPQWVMMHVPPSWQRSFPANVWLGTSVEHQRAADERIVNLCAAPASVRFLSCEPLLGPVTLATHVGEPGHMINWVIVGGESGPGARPMELAWAQALVDECQAAGTPVFMKQLGSHAARELGAHGKGEAESDLPEPMRVRQFPESRGAVILPLPGGGQFRRVFTPSTWAVRHGVQWFGKWAGTRDASVLTYMNHAADFRDLVRLAGGRLEGFLAHSGDMAFAPVGYQV